MSFHIFIRNGATVNACFVGRVNTPVVPPILGPCNVLEWDNQIGVYDCDGKLVTTYTVSLDGSVLEPTELSGS